MDLVKSICDKCGKEYVGCFWDIDELCDECKQKRNLIEHHGASTS